MLLSHIFRDFTIDQSNLEGFGCFWVHFEGIY
jgi:hypothetical protein